MGKGRRSGREAGVLPETGQDGAELALNREEMSQSRGMNAGGRERWQRYGSKALLERMGLPRL